MGRSWNHARNQQAIRLGAVERPRRRWIVGAPTVTDSDRLLRSGRKLPFEGGQNLELAARLKGASSNNARIESLRPRDEMALKLEWFREQRPVTVYEAECRVYGYIRRIDRFECVDDRRSLHAKSTEQTRSVTAVDEQPSIAREPAADIAAFDSAGVQLGVDDPDAAHRHYKVVDVRSRPRTSAIVHDMDAFTSQPVKARAQ